MLLRKSPNERGFTLVELLIVMVLTGIASTTLYTLTNTSISQYLALQADSISFSELTDQSQRISKVVRGLTDITVATNDEMTMYAYFAPNDSYVSLIRYYKNPTNTTLFADVTPMTANPPNGSLINSSQRTFTIIQNFHQSQGINTFEYLDSSGAILGLPINDLHTIKGVRINLAVPSKSPTQSGNQSITLQVSLRNRKTNL